MNSRLIAIIRKEFIQIFRDPRTLVLVIVMPMLQLFLLGYAATTDVKTYPSPSGTRANPSSRAPYWMPFGRRTISALIIRWGQSRSTGI